MRDGLKLLGVIAGIILFIAFIVAMIGWERHRHENAIREWCNGQGYSVVELEHCNFDYGPFWVKDDDSEIYRTVVIDRYEKQHFIWHRSNTFSWSHEEYKR